TDGRCGAGFSPADGGGNDIKARPSTLLPALQALPADGYQKLANEFAPTGSVLGRGSGLVRELFGLSASTPPAAATARRSGFPVRAGVVRCVPAVRGGP